MPLKIKSLLEWMKDNWGVTLLGGIAAGAAAVGTARTAKEDKPGDGLDYSGLDRLTELRLEGIRPEIKPSVLQFLREAKRQGITLRVTSGYRSPARQQKLYNKGRTEPGPRVTNAKPGYSWHNFGLAIDVVPLVDGRAEWDDTKLWQRVGRIGEGLGFVWGGRWTTISDKPHFHKTMGYTLEELRQREGLA